MLWYIITWAHIFITTVVNILLPYNLFIGFLIEQKLILVKLVSQHPPIDDVYLLFQACSKLIWNSIDLKLLLKC